MPLEFRRFRHTNARVLRPYMYAQCSRMLYAAAAECRHVNVGNIWLSDNDKAVEGIFSPRRLCHQTKLAHLMGNPYKNACVINSRPEVFLVNLLRSILPGVFSLI